MFVVDKHCLEGSYAEPGHRPSDESTSDPEETAPVHRPSDEYNSDSQNEATSVNDELMPSEDDANYNATDSRTKSPNVTQCRELLKEITRMTFLIDSGPVVDSLTTTLNDALNSIRPFDPQSNGLYSESSQSLPTKRKGRRVRKRKYKINKGDFIRRVPVTKPSAGNVVFTI